jgi:hypothetical protein
VHGWRASDDARGNAVAPANAARENTGDRGNAVARVNVAPEITVAPRNGANRSSAAGASIARRGSLLLKTVPVVSLVVGSLAGCSALGLPGGAGTSASPVPSASASPAASSAEPPVLLPGGTAEENRPLFDAVSAAVVAADPEAGGRALVDALVAAGFDKAAMEVTDDTTAIGGDADAVQFAVRASDGCIIGERSASGYASLVAPVLGTGRCLVGQTRAIDW